jgi:hypothetical protein
MPVVPPIGEAEAGKSLEPRGDPVSNKKIKIKKFIYSL